MNPWYGEQFYVLLQVSEKAKYQLNFNFFKAEKGSKYGE